VDIRLITLEQAWPIRGSRALCPVSCVSYVNIVLIRVSVAKFCTSRSP